MVTVHIIRLSIVSMENHWLFKKKIWNIGSKKTKVRSEMAKSVAGTKVKMATRKEHMNYSKAGAGAGITDG